MLPQRWRSVRTGGVCRVAADGSRVLPAALALVAGGVCSCNAQALDSAGSAALALDQLHMGDDHQVGQLVHGDAVQQVIDGIAAVQGDGSFQRSADQLFGTGLLQHLLDLVAHGDELCPLCLEGIVGGVLAGLGHLLEHHILFIPSVLGMKSQIS